MAFQNLTAEIEAEFRELARQRADLVTEALADAYERKKAWQRAYQREYRRLKSREWNRQAYERGPLLESPEAFALFDRYWSLEAVGKKLGLSSRQTRKLRLAWKQGLPSRARPAHYRAADKDIEMSIGAAE